MVVIHGDEMLVPVHPHGYRLSRKASRAMKQQHLLLNLVGANKNSRKHAFKQLTFSYFSIVLTKVHC